MMHKLTAIFLSFAVLVAPGCSMYEALGGYADAQESLTRRNLELQEARAENAELRDHEEETSRRLASAQAKLEVAISPEQRADLEAQVASLSEEAKSAHLDAKESRERSEQAALAQARAEGRADLAKELVDANGEIVSSAADATGGPAAGGIVRIGLVAASSLAAAWGSMKAAAA